MVRDLSRYFKFALVFLAYRPAWLKAPAYPHIYSKTRSPFPEPNIRCWVEV